MHRTLILFTGAAGIFAGIVAAQSITVTGTGDPARDIPAVQAAVDQGGRVVLAGHFSFEGSPTVVEAPSVLYTGTALGTIRISKDVEIVGAQEERGEMPDINGGTNPFYVDAAGSRVTIQGLHFVHSRVSVIRVVAARGLVVASNRIEGVARGDANALGIIISTTPGPPTSADLQQAGNVSGTLWIANNEIDLEGAPDGNYLGILVFAVGKSPDQEADVYISGNDIRNSTERPINLYSIGGRAYIQRNRVTTGDTGFDVAPSGDVIHIVGPGQFLVSHNRIDCAWTSGTHAGIRLQGRSGQVVSHAIVEDNDINMATPDGTAFTATSSAIDVRGAGEGNMVLNNRIRGRANFALSVITDAGTPQGTTFLMNDVQYFSPAEAGLFVDAGGNNTVLVGQSSTIEDHGSGTVVVSWPGNARGSRVN